MTVSATRVLNIESGESPTNEEIQQFLAAVETDEAKEFAAYLAEAWGSHLKLKPAFDHPSRRILHNASELAQRLDALRCDANLTGLFLRQVELYSEELLRLSALGAYPARA